MVNNIYKLSTMVFVKNGAGLRYLSPAKAPVVIRVTDLHLTGPQVPE